MREVKETITCDTCNTDISPRVTCYPRQDILRVTCLNVAQHLEYQMIYSVAMRPIIEQDLYFCGLECMKKYQEKKDGNN